MGETGNIHPTVCSAVIDIATRAFERAFAYAVPEALASEVQVGSAVLVEFGHRPAVAYVVSLEVDPALDLDRLKPIEAVLGGPYFSEDGAKLAFWVAHEYVAPLSDAIHLLTPPGPAPKARRVVAENGSVSWTIATRTAKQVEERWVSLAPGAAEFTPAKTAIRQQEILTALAAGPMPVSELAARCSGDVSGAIRSLAAKGVVEVEMRRRVRGAGALPPETADTHVLTDGQREALDAINDAVSARNGDVVVLDGVTGSGKTEVYLRAVRKVLEEGGGAIILVPEISLTPQTVKRFRSRFGDQVAVLHSRLSTGERFDQWDMLRQGIARVAVGARSALFAPVDDLRLIIIDEEHEDTYKQESSPRYNAIHTAAHYASQIGAALVLGSATPSIDTLSRCESGAWRRIELPERASGRPLPPVTVVDLAHEFEIGNRSMFAPVLTEQLIGAMKRGEKAVILYNRRGFARFLLCRECGYVPRCDECSLSLTYHEVRGREPRLMCHNCGRIYPVPARCPSCGSPYLRRIGKGTEQVEGALRELLVEHLGTQGEDVPIVRMDADTVRLKGAHEQLLSEFAAAPRGILLGTQMIAKGLDFPDVTVAAVINADTSLNLPDFRAGERTYQLIEQVAGRAGRDELPGSVVVQTYWPDHPALLAAAAHDRSVFLETELADRQALGYPPFTRMANLRIWGRDRVEVQKVSVALADRLREVLVARGIHTAGDSAFGLALDKDAWQVLGPTPCLIERSRNAWQWHVVVKAPPASDLPDVMGEVLRSWKPRNDVSVAVDIDPSSLF